MLSIGHFLKVSLCEPAFCWVFPAEFLDPDTLTLPAGGAPVILEVKWDAYLPDIIRDAVCLPGRRVSAFSKYAQCRIYG